jgi:hypothetical protein
MAMLFHNQNPDEIAAGHGISLAQTHTALAYYYEHKAEIDEDIRQQIATTRQLREEHLANGGSSLLTR